MQDVHRSSTFLAADLLFPLHSLHVMSGTPADYNRSRHTQWSFDCRIEVGERRIFLRSLVGVQACSTVSRVLRADFSSSCEEKVILYVCDICCSILFSFFFVCFFRCAALIIVPVFLLVFAPDSCGF